LSITTKIQWVDSTCNPTMGCEGCELWNPKTGVRKCYAGVLHTRFGGVTKGYSPTFDELTFWPGRMAEAAGWADLAGATRRDKPWLNGLPRLIFVSDMSDALSSVVPFEFLEQEVIQTALSPKGQRHQWLWLTKRPDRMARLSDDLKAKGISWPRNLWAGTSITSQGTTPRIKHLLRVGEQQTIRFLSVEPQHEPITFGDQLARLDWVIQGGESGRGAATFRLEWAHDLIRQCREAGAAYFLKQLGSVVYQGDRRLTFEDGHAGDWSEWPQEVRIRQMPKRIMEGVPAITATVPPRVNRRTPLQVVEVPSKGTQAALKAWATRRENERRRARSEAARKAWRTRRGTEEKGV
jgi:protein gp37